MDRLPITAGQVDKAGCAGPFNEVAQYFNKKLKEAVGQLRMDLPLAALTYVDVYSLKYTLINQARQYGILLLFLRVRKFLCATNSHDANIVRVSCVGRQVIGKHNLG